MYNLAICLTYFIEMLIAYIFFLQIGEKKYDFWKCCLIGTAIFEIGALSDIVFSNIIWLNALMFIVINFFFAFCSFNIKATKILFYSIILDIFSTAIEFAAIFLISTVTNTKVTEYVDNLTFFIIDVSVSKILYFITCLILSELVKKEKRNIKIPIALYFYPVVITFALILFWSICADYKLSNAHQILLSVTSVLMFLSTVLLFIIYQNNVAKENYYLIIEKEMEKINIDRKFYDVLEKQNEDLRTYAHDTKNHLNAIHSLNSNPEIDTYLAKMINRLETYSSVCHSGNHMLDVIINKYVTECEMKKIEFSFDVCVTNLNYVKNDDLVTILSNSLDNAMEAADISSNRKISIATDHINTYDVITIMNSCDNSPKTKGDELVTTKNNKDIHGLGIKSIKKTLNLYNGDYQWEYNKNENEFTLIISLLPQEK